MTMVRIYQPPKTAMQSGRGRIKEWWVEFESDDSFIPEPLMGWVPSQDTSQQLHLSFPSLEDALYFAKTKGLNYNVCSPPQISSLPKRYSFNFTNPRVRGT